MADDGNDNEVVPYAAYLKEVIQRGILGEQLPVVTTDPNRLEQQAKKAMSKRGFDYIIGGAGEAATMDANREAFRQWKIIPRVLKPTTPRDLTISLFGQKLATPVLMAPIGVQSLFHEDKEIGVANACAALKVPYVLSTAASTSIEELAKQADEGPKWFQLYWPIDNEITTSILERAKANGYTTLVVTLDTWTLAWRPYDLDTANVPFVTGTGNEVGFQDPVFLKKFAEMSDGEKPEDSKIGASLYWTSESFPGVSHSWDDLKLLRKNWEGPIVLKGVLSADDAKLAVEHGMDGIIVSNHGGRQLDGAIASLDVLPEIVEAVGSKTTVMLDSGIRTGADMFKALALGAEAVFVGRPVAYGLGIDGQAGAEAVLAGLLADLDLTMGFAGVKTIPEIKKSILRKVKYAHKANL